MKTTPIYLDHASASPLRPEVVEAIAPWATDRFGHPGARGHRIGWAAEAAIEFARAQVADWVGAEPAEVVFTSGGAEADNLAILGVAEALEGAPRHIVVSAIEGRAVLDAIAWLERRGVLVTRLSVDATGRVGADALAAALRDDTVLVSIQAANAEIGTTQDLGALGAVCRERGIAFHADAVAAAPWTRFEWNAAPIDLLSLSAETLGAPSGVGALIVRRRRPRVRIKPRLLGGAEEGGRRAGVPNVLGAVGLGAACAALRSQGDPGDAVRARRDAFFDRLRAEVSGIELVGHPVERLPNHLSIAVAGVEGESLLVGAPGVAFATGSACSSAALEASHVLAALGFERSRASTVVRFTLGPTTTAGDLAEAAHLVAAAIGRLRAVGQVEP